MKKYIVAFSIAAIAATAALPALAHDGGENENRQGAKLGVRLDHFLDANPDNSKFVVLGTVSSKTSGSLVITVKTTANVPNLVNSLATVNVNSDTKFTSNNKVSTLADIVVGNKVIAIGTVSGSTLTATSVHINVDKKTEEQARKKAKAFGEVTAKTDTSITIKNSLTNTTQTLTVDEDTKVKINGEVKTMADVQVGDSGWVKFKTSAGVMIAKIINLFR
jgi:hypothetical protein